MKTVDFVAKLLVVVGAINWGLVGAFGFNLVETIFSFEPALIAIIYILVGISGLWGIKMLMPEKSMGMPMQK